MEQMNLDRWFLRQDVIDQLLAQGGDTHQDAVDYADHIMELAHIEQAEYQSLKDPFDRSVAIVFELVRSEEMNPWSIDLEHFVKLFGERIKKEANTVDLPSCGRLIRLAWAVLRHQAENLYERMLLSEEEDLDYMPIDGWEMEYDDAGFAFTTNVITGEADQTIPGLFQERVRRDGSQPVTLGELLGALREACIESEEFKLREQNREKHAAAVKEAISSVGSKMHDEDIDADLKLCWDSIRSSNNKGEKPDQPIDLKKIQDNISKKLEEEYDAKYDDIDEQAWVTTLVASLHLTHIGATEIWQEEVPNGPIFIRDKHPSLQTFDAVMALCKKEKDEMSQRMEKEAGGRERYQALQKALAARAEAAKAAQEEKLSREQAALEVANQSKDPAIVEVVE